MNVTAWLLLICCVIQSCVGSVDIRELQLIVGKRRIIEDAIRVGEDVIQELFWDCGICAEMCSEAHLQTTLQNMFPSMPWNESDYFCHEEQAHYDFCQSDQPRSKPEWNTSFWHYLYTFLAQSASHTWWSPCAFTTLGDPDLDGNGCLSRKEIGIMLDRVIRRLWQWTRGYHTQMDIDSDGCASTTEITDYLTRRSPSCAFNLLHELPCLNLTDGCECSSGVSKSELAQHLTSSVIRNVASAVALRQQVRNEHASVPIGKEKDEEEAEDEDEDEDEGSKTIFFIALISGIVGLVVLVAFAVSCWYQHNQRDALRQPQKLLRAKIDAWSRFDDNLIAKTSTLHPSFVHCLGLGGFQSDQLSLLRITHNEDVEAMSSLLHQMKSNKDLNSLPLMAQVRFKYGVTDDGQVIEKLYTTESEDHVEVEILMAWSSSTSIIVGLTSLSAASPPRPFCHSDLSRVMSQVQQQGNDDDLTDLQSSCQVGNPETGEYILNPPSQVCTSSASDAASFKSMEVETHRGGQITKNLSDSKGHAFKQGIRTFSREEMPEVEFHMDGGPSGYAADNGTGGYRMASINH